MSKKVIASTMIGNALEWYDYTLYGYFAHIIAKLFFPAENHFISMFVTFAVFAIGFVVRPLGGVFFGIIGDKYGRKVSLSITILLIAVPTGIIGLLPTYHQIGIAASVMLIFMRLLQGLSLGGEFSSAATYIIESAPKGKKVLYGSTSTTSLGIGVMCASLFALVIDSTLSKGSVMSFGWRIPFILSFIFGIVGFYVRKNLSESLEFESAKLENKITKTPIREIFAHHFPNILIAWLAFISVTIPFYSLCIFSKTILINLGYSMNDVNVLSFTIVGVFIISNIIFGFVFNERKPHIIMTFACIMTFLAAIPLIVLIKSMNFQLAFLAMAFGGMLIALYQSTFPAFFVSLFDVPIRLSAISISYNIPAVLFGGTAPMLLSFLIIKTPLGLYSVAYYIMFGTVLSLAGIVWYCVKNNKN